MFFSFLFPPYFYYLFFNYLYYTPIGVLCQHLFATFLNYFCIVEILTLLSYNVIKILMGVDNVHIDDEDISKKNQMIALILCVLFGNLGIHRFYVGKYITGAILFAVGGTSIVAKVLGFGYAFIAIIASFIVLALDTYALYSDSFTDGKGKLVIGYEKNLVYNTLEEREQKLYLAKLDKVMCLAFGVAGFILYYLVFNVILK